MTAVEKAIYIPVMWLAISLACGWIGYKLGLGEKKPLPREYHQTNHVRVLPPRPQFYDQDAC